MTVVGRAVLELSTDTRQFKRGLNDAKSAVAGFQTAERDAMRTVAQSTGTITSNTRAQIQSAAAINASATALNNKARAGIAAANGLGRLQEPLRGVLTQVSGLHPAVGQLTQVLGSLAVGSTVMVGVLAGLSAIALGYRKITENAREAKEAAEKALQPIRDFIEARRILNAGGETQLGLDQGLADLEAASKEIRSIQSRIAAAETRPNDEGTIFALGIMDRELKAAQEKYRAAAAIVLAGRQALREEAAKQTSKDLELVRESVAAAAEARANIPAIPALAARAVPTGFFPGGPGPIRAPGLTGDRLSLDPGQIEELHRLMGVANDELSELQVTMSSVADAGLNAFINFATGSKNAVRDFVADAIKELTRLAIKMGFLKLLGVATGGLSSAAIGAASAAVSGLNAKGVFARAGGGPVSRNQPYMVGERGPELFVPSASGSITPNHAMAGAGGAPLVMDFSRFPAAPDPVSAARDVTWQTFLGHSLDALGERGHRRGK